jgi:hypothetical protein
MHQQKKTTRYRIYYRRPEYFEAFLSGFDIPDPARLTDTHVELRDIEASSLGAVYGLSQAEVWSPNGEARSLILMKRLAHTSMSVGDVVEDLDGGEMYMCGRTGWQKIL